MRSKTPRTAMVDRESYKNFSEGAEDKFEYDDHDVEDATEDDEEDAHQLDRQGFEEDTYSSAIVSLVKDTQFLSTSTKVPMLRVSRMTTQILLLWVNIALQAFLMVETKRFITARYVHDIREVYDTFERTLYDEITLTVNGKARGVGGEFTPNFHPERFANLTETEKYNVCNIPYSQPWFFRVVLCIWSFTCVSEIRTTIDLMVRLICSTPTSKSMRSATTKVEDSPNEMEVVSLTRGVKGFILITMLIPRMLLTSVLLWLGSRWLASTNCFEYLLLNAVALEFILNLPSLLYRSVVPMRTKRDVEFLKMNVTHEGEEPTVFNLLLPYAWMGLVVLWMFVYYHVIAVSDFGVLPQYNFDVHNVCVKYIAERYAV